MAKYILSTRTFKPEFIKKMKEIAPDYEFITSDTQLAIVWDQVICTIGWKKEWEKSLLHEKTSLKWVQSISAGVDTLPLKEFSQYGILLSNGRGIHARSITDHLLALLFMATRGIFQAIQQQHQKLWDEETIPYTYLADTQILIAGTGQIGQALAKALHFFGCTPIGINTNGHPVDYFFKTYPLDSIYEQAAKADYVINILPLTSTTFHLYDAVFFQNMKKSGTFINVGRGANVDTAALVAALELKEIAFVALDVFEEEPLPKAHPLWQMENVLITPHISGKTPHFQHAFMLIFLENLQSFYVDGKLLKNRVDLEKGY